MKKPRKPLGRFWFGNFLQVDIFIDRYGIRGLKDLRNWLNKVIDWAEANKPRKRKKT